MLSKNKIKFINSIKKKKYRDQYNSFFVEGEKLVDELIKSNFEITELFATNEWIEKNSESTFNQFNISQITNDELSKISALSTPNKVMAVTSMPEYTYNKNQIKESLSILLDDIKDPGNLGTIIRIADWFGIENIFCTPESVDLYNPKVVQATMGAIFRVKVHYVDFKNLLQDFKDISNFNIYGTFLEGDNIYKENLPKNGFIIMGNESHGISDHWKPFINKKLFIPSYPMDAQTSESLNISIATAIVCSEFRRRV